LEFQHAVLTAIAPRYKTDTNVIFEIQNEPDMGGWGGIPEHENSLYQLIRSYAPNTPIIAWSVSTTSGVDILGMIGRGNQINYSNAAFGFHVYGGMSVASTKDMISEVRNAGYPIISTEFAVDGYSPDGLIDAFEATQTSWVVLTDGFCDAATGACYGANSPQTLKITWPKDYTAERSQ